MLLSKGYALAILASISSIANIDCVQGKNPSVLKREYGRNSKVRTGKKSGLRFVPNSSHRALKSPSKGKGSGDTETVSAPSKGKGSGDTMLSQELGSRSGFTNECYVHLLDLASNTVNIQDASAPTKGSYSSKGKSFSLRAPQRRLSSSKGSSKGSTSGTANTEENPEKDAAFSIEKYSKCVKEATNDLIGDIKIPAERRILIELLVSLQGDTGMMESLTSLDHCDLDWVSCDDGLITKIDLSLKGLKGVLPSNMKGLTSLLELNLTGTNLSFDVNLFTKLPKSLKKMFFSEISYLPTKEDLNALKDLTSLIDFVYNYNGVTHELAYLPFLENVKRVFLKGNLMTCIPVFGENTQLQLLDLECNDIYAINNVCGVFGKESQLIITGNTHIIQESLAFISDCTNVIVTQNEKFQCKNKENQENLDEVPSAQSAPSKGKGSIDAVPPNPAPIQPNLCDPTSCIGANEVCNDSSGIIVCDCEIGFDHVGGDCVSEPGKVCDPASCIGANEVCNDSSGIIVCECEIGFQRNLDGDCVSEPGNVCDPASCIGANEVCNDSSGIIVCECEIGFQRNLDGDCVSEPGNVCDPASCIGANEVCNDSSGIIVCECEIGFQRNLDGDCVSEPGKVCDPASCIGANEVCNDSSGIIVCECEIGFQRNLDGNCEELPFDPIDDSFGCIEQPDFAMTDPKCTSTIGIQATRSNISAGTVTLKMVYGGKDIAGLLTEGFYYTVTANIVGSGDCTVIPYENPERPEGACENMKSQIGSTTESGELWSEAILTYRLGGYEEKCCIDEIDVSGENILIDHGFVAGFDTEFTVAIHFDLLLEGCGDDDDVPQTAWAMHPVGDCPLSDPDYLVVASRHGWGKAVVFKTPASAS